MNRVALRYLIFWLLLVGCREDQSQRPTATKLFPMLSEHLDQLSEIQIRMRETQLTIFREDDKWFLGPPHSAPVHPQLINEYLLELYNAAQGQKVAIAPTDYASLGLTCIEDATEGFTARPVEVTFSFEDNIDKISIVLGEFNLPNSGDVAVYGQKALARRYVRFLEDDTVVLTPSSLLFLAPAAESWENTVFRPVKNLKNLTVITPDGFHWQAGRDSSYGPIRFYGSLAGLRQDPELVKLFNSFLAFGSHAGLLPINYQSKTFSNNQPHWQIQAQDKDGTRYHISLGETYNHPGHSAPGNDLSEGMLKLNQAKPGAFYVAKMSITKGSKEGDQLHRGSEHFQGRFFLFPDLDLNPIFSLTQQIRESHQLSSSK